MALPGELPDGRAPMFLVSGFLGSGKTTVLNHLLAQPEMRGTAVLINEFGEVGIDNLLISEIRGDLLLLTSGCVCCQYLGELSDAVKDLFAKREAGEIPRFDRLVLETTGLADPVRLVDTVLNDPALSLLVYLDSVVVTVDAVLGRSELAEHPESVKQAALADRILLTKVDLAAEAEREALLRDLLKLNPMAPVRPTAMGRVSPEEVLGAGLLDEGARGARLDAWLAVHAADAQRDPGHGALSPLHGNVTTFAVRLAEPVHFPSFASWFSALVRSDGARLLRVKGLLRTLDDERPMVVQSVQWILCPTSRLAAWPDDDRSSRLVFIARDLFPGREDAIRAELAALAAGSPGAAAREAEEQRAAEAAAAERKAAREREGGSTGEGGRHTSPHATVSADTRRPWWARLVRGRLPRP